MSKLTSYMHGCVQVGIFMCMERNSRTRVHVVDRTLQNKLGMVLCIAMALASVRIKEIKLRGWNKDNQIVICGCPSEFLVVRKLPQYETNTCGLSSGVINYEQFLLNI